MNPACSHAPTRPGSAPCSTSATGAPNTAATAIVHHVQRERRPGARPSVATSAPVDEQRHPPAERRDPRHRSGDRSGAASARTMYQAVGGGWAAARA